MTAAAFTVQRYGAKFWCVLKPAGDLLAVTLYRKGAAAVADLCNQLTAAPAGAGWPA